MDAVPEGGVHYLLERHPSGFTIVRIVGELDACNAGGLEDDLRPRLARTDAPLVLDLRHLTYIDSSGIRLLLTLIHGRGGQASVTLVRPSSGVARRALDMVGISRFVPTLDHAPDSLRAFYPSNEPGAGAF